MGEVSSLVDRLQHFCRAHLAGDGDVAAAEMLAFVRDSWIECEDISLTSEPLEGLEGDQLALGIVQDVGELAKMLLGTDDVERTLTWSRANLIADLEHYRSVVGSG